MLKFEAGEKVNAEPLIEKIRCGRWDQIDPTDLYRTLKSLAEATTQNLEVGDLGDDPGRNFYYASEAEEILKRLFAAMKRRVGRPRKLGHSPRLEIVSQPDGSARLRTTTAVEVVRRKVLLEAGLAVREARRSGGDETAILAGSLKKKTTELNDLAARRFANRWLKEFLEHAERAGVKVVASTSDRTLKRVCLLRASDLPKVSKTAK